STILRRTRAGWPAGSTPRRTARPASSAPRPTPPRWSAPSTSPRSKPTPTAPGAASTPAECARSLTPPDMPPAAPVRDRRARAVAPMVRPHWRQHFAPGFDPRAIAQQLAFEPVAIIAARVDAINPALAHVDVVVVAL